MLMFDSETPMNAATRKAERTLRERAKRLGYPHSQDRSGGKHHRDGANEPIRRHTGTVRLIYADLSSALGDRNSEYAMYISAPERPVVDYRSSDWAPDIEERSHQQK